MPPYSDQDAVMHFDDSCTSFNTLVDAINCHQPLHETNERTTQRERRSVRFSEDHVVCETLHKSDMGEEEVNNYWLSYEELRALKMDCRSLVGMMNDGLTHMLLEDDDFCLRGVEQHGGERGRRRNEMKRQLFQEVLDAQERCKQMGIPSAESIAKTSLQNSSELRREAGELGRFDAIVVRSLQ